MVFSPGLFLAYLAAFFGGVGGASLVAEEGHCSSSQPPQKRLGLYYGRLCDWCTDSPKINGPNDERTPPSV